MKKGFLEEGRYRLEASRITEERCAQRLVEEFDINSDAVDLVLHLRHQVVDLMNRVRDLESELSHYQNLHQIRIERYRAYVVEAKWEEGEAVDD